MSNDLFILDFILISASYNTTLLAKEKGKKNSPWSRFRENQTLISIYILVFITTSEVICASFKSNKKHKKEYKIKLACELVFFSKWFFEWVRNTQIHFYRAKDFTWYDCDRF